MPTETPIVRDDQFSVEEDLLSLAKSYFFDDNEEVAISTLKPSIFGFIAQTAAMVVKGGVYHRNAFYDEFFLNTASMNSSIYSFAKLYNYQVENARPANIQLSLAIKEEDILAHSYIDPDNTSNRKFRLNKATIFKFGDFSFMLPCAIDISLINVSTETLSETKWIIQARYDLTDYNLKDYVVVNPYIKMFSKSVSNKKWYIFKIEAYQMEMKEYIYDVLTTDIDQNILYNIDFQDQLAGFKVEVMDPSDISIINPDGDKKYKEILSTFNNAFEIDKENIDAGTLVGPYYNWNRYCYYAFPNEGSMQIYFSTLGDYRPNFGSNVRIKVFTTKGSKGNFSYNGTIGIKMNREDENPGEKDKSGISIILKNITDSLGGGDRLDIMSLKKELVKKVLVRNNLITEIDLNYFFNTVISLASINGGKLEFIKHRDDVIKRLFSAFILLKDKENRIVPTNTVDLIVDYNTLEEKNFVLKTGEIIIFDQAKSIFRPLLQDEYPEEYLVDRKSFVYSLPYLMYIRLDPFPRVIYYRTTVNESLPVEFDQNSEFPFEVVINSINIKRNGLFDNYYAITVDLATNIDEDLTYPPVEGTIKSNNLKVRLVIRNEKKTSNDIICCIDLEKSTGNDMTWFTKLLTNDELSSDNNASKGNIIVLGENGNLKDVSGAILTDISLPEKFRIEASVLYNPTGVEVPENIGTLDTKVANSREKRLNDYALMTDISDYGIVAVFVNENQTVSLHKSLASITLSDIKANNDGTVKISRVGLIGTRYFSDYKTSNEVENILEQYETVIGDNIDKLENNTQVSIKFFNTFGPSQHYSIDSTNIFIELKIKLNTSDRFIISKIKNKIVKYVEDSNESDKLSFSNIVTMLETSFPEIAYISIVGINQLGQQIVERTTPRDIALLTKEQLEKYVPEFLNINLETLEGKLSHSVKISFI